jgi:type II secretory pathway component PulF
MFMTTPVFYAVNYDLAQERAAASIGIKHVLYSVSGIIAPSITAIVLEKSGNFSAVFWLMIGLNVFASIVLFLFQKPKENLEQTIEKIWTRFFLLKTTLEKIQNDQL